MFLNNHDSNGMHVTLLNVTDKASSEQLENFKTRKNHHIVTLYYRDGCPPCDRMKPDWKKACEQFKRRYRCKNEDARERTVIASVDDNGIKHLNKVFHAIEGTPTLLYMSDNKINNYDGKTRGAKHLLQWLHSSLKNEIEPVPRAEQNKVHGLMMGGCWDGTTGIFSSFGKSKSRSKRSTLRRRNGLKRTIKNRKIKNRK
jgi:thiol-disulfide isomerase/thioredoxin